MASVCNWIRNLSICGSTVVTSDRSLMLTRSVYVCMSLCLIHFSCLFWRVGGGGEWRPSAFLCCFVFQWSYLVLVCTRDVQYYYETRDVILYRFLISFLCVLFLFSFMTSERIECVTRFALIRSATVFRRCSANIVLKLTIFKCFWHIKILIYIYIYIYIYTHFHSV